MQFFRLLHRQTKSEGDVSTLLAQPASARTTTPVFVSLQQSLPSFDPTRELYASPIDLAQGLVGPHCVGKLNARITELEAQLVHLQTERSALEQDLADYSADLLHARTELYSEMLRGARHQQQYMDDFRAIQELEARHQRFCSLLVDIGIPRPTVDTICQAIHSGTGSPENMLVDAIKDATDDDDTLLARLKPIVRNERTPEHYQSALNLTLSIRKELKSQKKRSKFWKKLAQEEDRHANTVTPSPSDVSSVRQDLSPERQDALDALIARRRAAKCSSTEGDVFGGRRRESALDTLVTSLASRPRRSFQEDLRLSSVSSSASSTSTYPSYHSSTSRIPRESTNETPTVPSRLPSTLSTSLRHSSRTSTQSIVLGSINLNVSRSSSVDSTLLEEAEQQTDPAAGPVSTITLSQALLQNTRCASQENGHRRMSSTTSRRSLPTRSTRSSFRLSSFSPIRASRPIGPLVVPDLDVSGNMTIDAPSFDTPDIMRLSDLETGSETDTPASSVMTRNEVTPFNDMRGLPKYSADTPFSQMELETQVASTPLDVPLSCKPLSKKPCPHDTRFFECLDCDLSQSRSTSVSADELKEHTQVGYHGKFHRADDCHHQHANSGTDTIPIGESKDSLFTTSASSLSANDTPAPMTPPESSPNPVPGIDNHSPISSGAGTGTRKVSIGGSMLPVLAKHLRRLSLSGTSPDRERLMNKLRGLRSLSRSRSRSRSTQRSRSGSGIGSSPGSVWRGSPARSESSKSDHCTESPTKRSGIPVLQRQRGMTVRARRTSVRRGQ